jgi:hypothetical protein
MGTQPNPNDPLLPFGSNRCKCAACGEYFTSDSTFRVHRVDDADSPNGRACRDPAKILDKDRKPRLRRTTSGHWASARRRVEYLDQE